MPTWKELLDGRIAVASNLNSAHYLECVGIVKARFPEAVIEQVGDQEWILSSGGEPLSHPHNSHYSCWAEAREILNVSSE